MTCPYGMTGMSEKFCENCQRCTDSGFRKYVGEAPGRRPEYRKMREAAIKDGTWVKRKNKKPLV